MRGRGRFGPLTERPFRLPWLGRTGSSIGDSLCVLALVREVRQVRRRDAPDPAPA